MKKAPKPSDPDKTVRVTCKANDYLPIESLQEFQGNLCELTSDACEKAKKSILKHGLFLPEAIWKDGDACKIIDGHARVRTLRQMQTEGYTIPPVPVIYVEAASEAEAKEKILLARSQYHRTTEEGLYQFIHENYLDWGELKMEVEFADINMIEFEKGYFGDEPPGGGGEGSGEHKTKCPQCGYEF